MVKEAQSHAEEDRRVRESAELRNEADSLCYSVERTIADGGEAVTSGNKERAEELMAQLRAKAREEVVDESTVKSLMNDLRGVVVLIQQEVSAAQATTGGAEGSTTDGATSEATNGEATDAEATDASTGEPVA
jgi:molecular chaperone DnaK